MKRLGRALGFAMALVVPAAMAAQSGSQRPLSLGISGGLSAPTGDFGKGLDAGYNVTGHLFYNLTSSGKVALRGDVAYDKWSVKAINDVNLRSLGYSANAIIGLTSSGTVRPYILGGAGFFGTKTTYNSGSSAGRSNSETNFGVQAGAGAQFQLSGFSTFAEARFVSVFGPNNDMNWLPIVFGVRF